MIALDYNYFFNDHMSLEIHFSVQGTDDILSQMGGASIHQDGDQHMPMRNWFETFKPANLFFSAMILYQFSYR